MQNNWSLKKLSELSGIPVNTVWRMEREYGVTLRNAYKIAGTFQLTIYELWSIPSSGAVGPKLKAGKLTTETVHELRLKRRWRLHDLAEVSGVSKATLVHVENGHIPTLRNAVRIAAALGVSVYQIWNIPT